MSRRWSCWWCIVLIWVDFGGSFWRRICGHIVWFTVCCTGQYIIHTVKTALATYPEEAVQMQPWDKCGQDPHMADHSRIDRTRTDFGTADVAAQSARAASVEQATTSPALG